MSSATADGERAAETSDVFHRGAFALVQPASGAHRAGIDAMILAAAVPSSFAGRLADLGAGAGAAGLAAAARCPHAIVTLVERSRDMAAFAHRSVGHPANTALASRVDLLVADVSLTGRARKETGLADNAFDFAIMNPPFNDARDRASPGELRRDAHVMEAGLFDAWLRTASAIVRPRGKVALIARPSSLADILPALAGRFGGVQIVPIHPRSDAAAIRFVVRATRGSRASLSLMPMLVLHEASGHGFTARAEAICNGEASLYRD